jgi:small Trp-rich protein
MYLVIAGVLLVLLRFADVPPVADWSWWLVLSPFGGAMLWWWYSDSTGLTQRKAMQKLEDRKEARRRQAFEALGMDYRRATRNDKKTETYRRVQEARVQKHEGKRDAARKRQADTMTRSSQFHSEMNSTRLSGFDEPSAREPKK